MWIKSICAKFNPVKINFSPLLLLMLVVVGVVLELLVVVLLLMVLLLAVVLWLNSWEDQER